VAALKAYRIFINIHTKTGYYKKEYVIWLQIFSAAILPNIIKNQSIFDQVITKIKRVFEIV